jgi:hypothetical protein
MIFLTVGRPALKLASPSAGAEVMGFIHKFGDARMPPWGVLAILSNVVLALFGWNGHHWLYVISLSTLILFVVLYNRLSKPINRLQTEAARTASNQKAREWCPEVSVRVSDSRRCCHPARMNFSSGGCVYSIG